VIIPCYNAAPWIGMTLESVFSQTWSDLEVIVVDDGSTDGSAELVEAFGRGRPLTLVRQQKRGASAARNVGLARANGEFVQLLDADDLIDPDKIAVQMARLEGQPRAVASARWGRFYGRPEDTHFQTETVSRDLNSLEWLIEARADGLGMMFPALWLIPMPIVRAAGPWREDLSLADDTEYFTRVLLAADRVLFCEAARARYRSGISGSLSGRKTAAHWASQATVIELCQQAVLARSNSERARRGFSLSWQHMAHACYPYDPSLAERALERSRALHPEMMRPQGGATFRFLSRLIGWRAARRLQVACGRP
jgi:GT2 family glycosyltransferase